LAADDPEVKRVFICTPDKDLAQCVVDDRVVQMDRRKNTVTDEAGVWAKFGVAPKSIPDWLALVGDTADGFPGLAGWGKRSASVALAHYGSLSEIPDSLSAWDPAVRRELRGAAKLAERLATERELALLFKDIATLRTKPPVLRSVASLRWRGPKSDFEDVCRHFRDPALADRAAALAKMKT
jgi:5'-3' exonuclease